MVESPSKNYKHQPIIISYIYTLRLNLHHKSLSKLTTAKSSIADHQFIGELNNNQVKPSGFFLDSQKFSMKNSNHPHQDLLPPRHRHPPPAPAPDPWPTTAVPGSNPRPGWRTPPFHESPWFRTGNFNIIYWDIIERGV